MVGVGGGVPVRVIEVSEGDLVGVTDFEGLVPRSTRVLVEAGLPGEEVASLPMVFSFVEAGFSSVNILVPKTTVGGAEISSVILDRVHPTKRSELIIKKKIGFFIDELMRERSKYSTGNGKASRAGCYPSGIAASLETSQRQIAE